jgi:uncharacterized protein
MARPGPTLLRREWWSVIDREELLGMLNNSGIAQSLQNVHKALLVHATNSIINKTSFPEEKQSQSNYNEFLLASVGPAQASGAMEFAINAYRAQGKLTSLSFNSSITHNLKLIENEGGVEEYQSFSNVLREFLLPRYAYLDFDRVVDPRHRVDEECGYPKFITPIMYRYMYDRDDMARRVVDVLPDESWAADPCVYENEDEETLTPFEERWQELCDDYHMMQYLYRMDRLAGIGHYGVLLLGIDDAADLEKPIDEPLLLAGARRSVATRQRNLLYMRPFDEYLSFIHQFETDVMSPRYGLPKFYNLVFLDMTIDAAGASIGTRLNRRVHWSRVVHIADNLQSSLVFGIPRMQPMFNRLLDLRKIKGGSAEMFWKGAFPGIAFEIDPRFVADDPEFDRESFKKAIRDYSDGLTRYLDLVGIKANSLAPMISDNPEKYVRLQLEAIAIALNMPIRKFMGTEEGRVASSQDATDWNTRLSRRQRMFIDPYVIRAVIDRFIAIGIMPPPTSGKYYVGRDDLNTSTDEDKANLALKYTQALSQYVASGIIHMIKPLDFMTMILRIKPSDAKKINEYVMSQGGYEKLKKVDPSQGAGVNGKRENDLTKGESSGTSDSRPTKRDSADKKSEGISS